MQNRKLVKILKTLTQDEFRGLNRWLKSPFFNTNTHLIILYEYLRHYFPEFDSGKLNKEKVFAKLFPQLDFNKDKFAALLKRLTRLTEDYLIWLESEKEEFDRRKRLLKVYANRNLFDLYERARFRFLEDLEKLPYRDLEYYQTQIELHADFYFHPLNNKYDLEDDSLGKLMENLDAYFVLSKLSFTNEMKSHERILKKKYDVHFLKGIEENQNIYQHNIPIKLYTLLIKLFEENSTSDFEELETIFFMNIDQLSSKDRQRIYLYGLNYASRQLNTGKSIFSKKAFEWYRFGLQDDLLIQNGKVSEISFGNIVICGCREKEFEWTEDFLITYQGQLHAKRKEDVVQYNRGLIYFYKGEFEKAFNILTSYDFEYSFQLKVRLTTLRVLFEQFLMDSTYLRTIEFLREIISAIY